MVTATPAKVVREPAYAKRLEQACDANPHCPDLQHGRLSWIASRLSTRLEKKIPSQTVFRWMHGEAKPRERTNVILADILGVDSTWLYLGIQQELTPRERRARNAMADGAVNLVAGLIQMDGGHPAFPEDRDVRAVREHIDLYAVIKGANYSFHVALGSIVDDYWSFSIPVEHEHIIVLGVVRDGFNFRVVEITPDMIEEHGTSTGRAIMIKLTDDLVSEGQITSFTDRL